MPSLIQSDLDEIIERCEKAPAGPWIVGGTTTSGDRFVGQQDSNQD